MSLPKEQLHRIPSHARNQKLVSSSSRWGDSVWYLDQETAGQRACGAVIHWDIALPDGSLLTDDPNATLLEEFRIFCWSLMVEYRDGRNRRPGSVATNMAVPIRRFARRMAFYGLKSLGQVDSRFCREFVDEVAAESAEINQLKATQLWRYVNLPIQLHRQNEVFQRFGVQVLADHPFRNKSAIVVAQQYAEGWSKRVPPVPDTLALKILSSAQWWMQYAAPDVVKLLDTYLETYNSGHAGNSKSARSKVATEAIEEFEFSKVEGTPWRDRIQHETIMDVYGKRRNLSPPLVLRRLIADTNAAACLILLGFTGMRISEIAGLQAENAPTRTDSRPLFEWKTSHSGFLDLIYLNGFLFKGTNKWEEVDWLIGCQPKDANRVPLVVHAVQTLQGLSAHWRDKDAPSELFLNFRHARGIPKASGGITHATTDRLNNWIRTFLMTRAGVHRSDVLEISSRRWRPTFAKFVFRSDRALLPAISDHFKHISLAVTEGAYIGSDQELTGELENTRLQEGARFFEALSKGEIIAGGAKRFLDGHRDELPPVDSVANEDEAPDVEMVRFVKDNDVRVWYSEWGKCLIGLDPEQARCHIVSGTAGWRARSPNWLTRTPELCLGCPNFAIDSEHRDFWSSRERALSAALNSAPANPHYESLLKRRLSAARQVNRVLRSKSAATSDAR